MLILPPLCVLHIPGGRVVGVLSMLVPDGPAILASRRSSLSMIALVGSAIALC